MKRVLITGGAGFIGSHLADHLLELGHHVRVLDNLTPQVHAGPPPHLAPEVELHEGDVRDPYALANALDGVDWVCHLAAQVGVGQSMYEMVRYTDVNNVGTAVLLEALAKKPPERLVVASSMSIYGEGLYEGGPPRRRTLEPLTARRWESENEEGQPLKPLPTPETKTPELESVYALSKFDQEQLCLMVGRAYRFPVTALRLFNVYGSRQALSNPYTGVMAIFASRLLNGNPPILFEDGLQKRDFVHANDVARALGLAFTRKEAAGEIINVGSGKAYAIGELAVEIGNILGCPIAPEITGRYRIGDVRHCFADIGKARRLLGFQARLSLREGLEELAGWLTGQTAHDRLDQASAELAARGLTV